MKYEIISIRKRKTIRVKRPIDLYNVLKKYTKNRQEQFLTITLNGAHDIVGIHITSIGIANRTIVHPREIFYHAIKDNACAIMIAHNHPSGQLNPSPEDKKITEDLIEAAKIMGMQFIDHLIIVKDNFYSFRENGLFN